MQYLIDTHKAKLLAAMPIVTRYEQRLVSLNDWWGKISLIGKINSYDVATTILEDMSRIQGNFSDLQEKLTHNLLVENLQKLMLDNGSKAQVAIDLLIRNLFERTADVGFLATDDDIRQFLHSGLVDTPQKLLIEKRLQEYVKKYSVYDEIIILDTNGQVKVHFDSSNRIQCSSDPLLAETLASAADYVETFRHSDLQTHRRHSLIYSCRITETNEKHSKVLGVLCLCFRFDDEMKGIFADLLIPGQPGILTIIDADGKVIASNEEQIVPINSYLQQTESINLITFQNQAFIVNTRQTNGYQGFFGLGWRGQMLCPLGDAFNHEAAMLLRDDYADIMHQASCFPKALREIRKSSSEINEDLSLLVLNGQITSARKNAKEFMPVLEAIKRIGADITHIFSDSNSLQEMTVISSSLNNVGFLAALATDIMDRNLYERANDCRWWALSSAFRQNLAHAYFSAEDAQQVTAILGYINALYTVYTNLFVYDADGKILAVSNAAQQGIVGTKLEVQTGAYEALKNGDSQSYGVSPFADTALYQDQHTYIYHAAITHTTHQGKVLGGIGIVFDSQPQFSAMLMDILPRDEHAELMTGCFAVFAERNKSIIAVANHPDIRVGELLAVDDSYFHLKNGERISALITFNGSLYVLGVAAAKGYREYKTKDRYHNDVLAFVFMAF